MRTGDVAFVNGAKLTGTGTQTLSAASVTINAGYYAGTTLSVMDADLAAENIKSGVDIFGVAGTAPIPSGTAVAGNVLTGTTFSSASGVGISGTMPNNGAVSFTPSTSNQAIAAGYHNGSEVVYGDSDLAAENIKSGANIFGVVGTYPWTAVGKTGQTVSYAAGDDGYYQKGATVGTRFTDNGNGTATDNLTGLIWLKETSYNNISGTYGTLTWVNALPFVAALCSGYCGLSDGSAAGSWRLPNVKELATMTLLPAGHPFTNVKGTYYLTSTTHVTTTTNMMIMSINNGGLSAASKTSGTGAAYVWPVRDGE